MSHHPIAVCAIAVAALFPCLAGGSASASPAGAEDALSSVADGFDKTEAAAQEPARQRPRPVYAVAVADATWHDGTRRRDVPVRIYAPHLKHGAGPFPLVVFSHGGGESREAFGYLGTHWARSGYIAVFLTHPGSDRKAIEEHGIRAMGGGGAKNFHLRPEDVRFVLDRLLSDDPGSRLVKGRLAADRVAVAGQCAGASTALAMVGLRANLPEKRDATFIDPRFTCAIALSPQPGGGRRSPLDADSWARIDVPTLMVTGTRDFNWLPGAKANPNLARMPFDGLPPGDKFLVEIKDAEHNAFTDSVPYYPARKRDPRHHGWIQRATTAFLDAYLKGDSKARDSLRNEVLEKETQGECLQEQKPSTDKEKPTASAGLGAADCVRLHDPKRGKDVQVRVTWPESAGPCPVIVFSHCVGGARHDYRPLVEHWARGGYVVIQADHADSRELPASGPRLDWADRTRDMAFVIDSLEEIGKKAPGAAGRMDARRVGAGGHLIGAYAACVLAGQRNVGPLAPQDLKDDRVRAALLLSPQGRGQGLTEDSWQNVSVPLMVLSGSDIPSRRTGNPAEWRREPYTFSPPGNKYLVWIEGLDRTYGGLILPAWGDDAQAANWIKDTTLAFWDAHLKQDAQARDRLRAWPIPHAEKERFRLECKAEASSKAERPRADVQESAEGSAGTPTADDTAVAADGDGPYDFSRLDQFLETSVPRLGGGCAFILIQGDRVIHRNAYGTFTPKKVVPIASSSKWISGGVIMALVDAGKISLDDPASKYLPYFTGKKAGITVRQMFSHTHGLTGNARDHLWNTALTMDEAVRAIAELELIADPGTALYYSGLGMQAAGRIGEIVTGKPWGEIFNETLGKPLAMNHTDYFAFGPTKNPNVAGSVRTCVDDYGNYLTMLLNRGLYRGKRILSEKAVATMLANQSGCLPVLRHPYDVLDIINPALAKAPYGIGCWLEDFDPKTGQTTAITSGGGFGCMPFLDLERNVAGVLLPHNRRGKTDAKGRRYNDAHRVYYEAKAIVDGILDRGAPPKGGRTPEPPTTESRPGPSETTAGSRVEVHGKVAADYSAENGGRAVLVMVDGKIVFERYDNGFDAATATHLHSATKGFWGPVIAAMIEDGLIESYDELASNTLPEWKDDPRKSRITLRHLLTLSAGLIQDVVNLQGHDRPTLAPDLYKHAVGVRTPRDPGAVFQYGPSCYYVLGEIMKRKLAPRKQTPLEYLRQRILDPIGVKTGNWVHDTSGNPHIPNGAHLTARNWVKYGQWLLQGGRWDGKQIVRKDLLDELVKPSKANPGHGLALWLNRPDGRGAHAIHVAPPGAKGGWIYHDGYPDLYAALGAGKCRMYVIPSLNMVALRQADSQGDRYEDHAFLSLLLTGEKPPAGAAPGGEALILQRLDRNGDGRIVPDETGPVLRRWFDRLDTDRDGALSPSELRPLLQRRNRLPQERRAPGNT